MANQRVLVDFLKTQAAVRAERVRTHRAMRNPNGQMVARFADEEKMLLQAADIVGKADMSTTTTTSDDTQRLMVAEQREKEIASAETVVIVAAADLPKVTANGKRIGRPPKMTMAQIKANAESPIGTAINDKD